MSKRVVSLSEFRRHKSWRELEIERRADRALNAMAPEELKGRLNVIVNTYLLEEAALDLKIMKILADNERIEATKILRAELRQMVSAEIPNRRRSTAKEGVN